MKKFSRFHPVLFTVFLCVALSAESLEEGAIGVEDTVEPTEATETLELTLKAALALIRDQNPLVMFNRERVQQALEQTFVDRSNLLPRVSLDAAQQRRRSARSFTGGTGSAFRADTFDIALEGSIPLLETQAYARYRLAELAYLIEQRDFEAALEDFLELGANIYFTHVRDLGRVDLIRSNIERDEQLLQLARDQVEAGVATRIDVTRAEVQRARSERQFIESKTVAENSLLRLKALLDFDLDKEISLVNPWVDESQRRDPSLAAFEEMQGRALTRPELVAAELNLDQARLARRAAGWQRLPTVELFGSYGYESGRIFDGDESRGWLIGIRASLPIFEGFRIQSEKRQADAAVRANEYLERDLRNNLLREYRTTLNEVESRYKQIEVALKELELASDEVELARQRFAEGVADNRELIDGQQNLANAEDGYLEAIFLYGLSRVAFARAVGAVGEVLKQ